MASHRADYNRTTPPGNRRQGGGGGDSFGRFISLALLTAAVVAVLILAGPSGRSIMADHVVGIGEGARALVFGRAPDVAPAAGDSLAMEADSSDAPPAIVHVASHEARPTPAARTSPAVVGDPSRAVWPQFRRGRTLFTPMGFVSVSVDLGAADVLINGRNYGRTPYTVRLRTGEHAVTVRASDRRYQPTRATVFVARGDTSWVVFEAVD